MVFSSSTFLMAFLPLTLLLYYGVGVALTKNVTVKNCILLCASLVFYAWGEPVYILLMLLSILFNFAAGRVIDNARDSGRDKTATAQFVLAVIFNLGVLGFFKYADFLVDNVNGIFGAHIPPLELPLPIGISFYTFQILSYIIDLYTGKIRVQKDLLSFALYISLFPQLIAGPIVKYRDIEAQLTGRKESWNKYSRGMARFVVGLAKKLMLANTLGAVNSGIQAMDVGSLSALAAWTGIACYTLQIYFDFSGYSDMAIGLGSMFGFSFNENFNYPYIATSITDFWRRWHISLSSWFRDYVYIPLGGNRRKTPRVIFNLLLVWLLTGLWHGAAWNFVLWGVFYGVLLIFEKYVLGDLLPRIPTPVRGLVTMLLVICGWVLFSAPDLTGALLYLKAMFGGAAGWTDGNGAYLLSTNLTVLLVGAFCATPVYRRILDRFDQKWVSRAKVVAYPLLFALCVVFMVSETYNPFLYFRF
ncbi:MAG: MBOAT family protein [Clostridia bacterium]|nr:MBOAT family protein [Clostridia bacterium]